MVLHTFRTQSILTTKRTTNIWKLLTLMRQKNEKLVLNLTKNGTMRFISDNEANRYVARGEHCNLDEWNNIQEQFKLLSPDLKLPPKGTAASKFIPDVHLQLTILSSDAGLSKAQQAHTDELLPFSLGSTTKFFDSVTITGIKKESLFYI